jgi:hypothetical protein
MSQLLPNCHGHGPYTVHRHPAPLDLSQGTTCRFAFILPKGRAGDFEATDLVNPFTLVLVFRM